MTALSLLGGWGWGALGPSLVGGGHAQWPLKAAFAELCCPSGTVLCILFTWFISACAPAATFSVFVFV